MTVQERVVYLLGDSISAGYFPAARDALAGTAEVRLRPDNGKDSRNLLARAPGWLAGQTGAVLHLNCGLHDLKRAHNTGQPQVPLDEYEANLRRLVPLLRPCCAALVWARTTPVRDGQPNTKKGFDRFNRDVQAYNAAADRVMAELGVSSNDLHGAMLAAGLDRCLSWDGVHMTDEGYAVLGRQVAAAALAALGRIAATAGPHYLNQGEENETK
jgi:lysophospholipase L1-like esterase